METKTFKEQLHEEHPKDPKHFPLWLVLLILLGVGASAYFGYFKTARPVIDTMNWITFRSDALGLEFKHPRNIVITEQLGELTFTIEDDKILYQPAFGLGISVTYDPEAHLETLESQSSQSINRIKFHGSPALKVVEGPEIIIETLEHYREIPYFVFNNRKYAIGGSMSGAPSQMQGQTFDAILDSISLIDINKGAQEINSQQDLYYAQDLDGWHTYRNEDLGFEVLLPPEYEGYFTTIEQTSDKSTVSFLAEVTNPLSVEDTYRAFSISFYSNEWREDNVVLREFETLYEEPSAYMVKNGETEDEIRALLLDDFNSTHTERFLGDFIASNDDFKVTWLSERGCPPLSTGEK